MTSLQHLLTMLMANYHNTVLKFWIHILFDTGIITLILTCLANWWGGSMHKRAQHLITQRKCMRSTIWNLNHLKKLIFISCYYWSFHYILACNYNFHWHTNRTARHSHILRMYTVFIPKSTVWARRQHEVRWCTTKVIQPYGTGALAIPACIINYL